MPDLTARMDLLPPYPLTWVPQKKRELIASGVDVIDLGAGDADLAPPQAAVEALARAARDPAMSRYGFGVGLPAFREAVARWMERRFGVRFDPSTEIVPLIGSKEGLAHLAFAYVGEGDVVIVPEPAYAPYVGGTVLADGSAYRVPLREENGFLLELDDVPADVLSRATMVYLNYPNNPTGAIAPVDYLERTVKRCREHDLLLVYDNAYSELAYDGYRPPGIFEIAGAREIAIEFHSFSKTYNMTGWRCGWAAARPEVAAALAKVKSFVDTGAFMPVQAAGVAALDGWDTFVPANVEVFRSRRDAAVDAFRAAGFACEVPRAAMYLWLRLPDGLSDAEFAKRLLVDEGVVVMPGSSFGASGAGYFRVSFITSPERLAEAARRAGRVLTAVAATA